MRDQATNAADRGSECNAGLGLPAEATLTTHDLALRFDASAAWLLNGARPAGPLVGAGAYLEAATRLRRQAAEIERLQQALRDIADPFSAWKRDLPEGYTLDGAACLRMEADPETYKRMAREALKA